MKILQISILFLLFTAIAFSGPKFSAVDGNVINTGNHVSGKEVNYEISFKNDGDADLVIENVTTTCGCSSALLSQKTIKPGESGIIKFNFNGIGSGKVQKAVMVYTNDETGIHTLTMEMNMLDPLTLNPTSIIAAGKKDDVINQVATLQNTLDKEIIINELTSNSPAIKVNSDKSTIGLNETANINISITVYEDSPVNGAIFIKTTEGEFQIPVFIDVQ